MSVIALTESGITSIQINSAVRSGTVERVRNGWVALPEAPPDVVCALRVGGRLSCLSVLKSAGIWCARDFRLHVRVPTNPRTLASPHNRRILLGHPERFGVFVHRSRRAH